MESHPLANEMHRWVLAAEDREIVGHLAAVAQYYRINGQRVIAHTPAEYQVLSQYGFHALSLMRTFFRTCQNCATCDMVPATIKIERWLGAEEAGRLRYAVKLLDVSGLSRFAALIPTPTLRLLNGGLWAIHSALTNSLGSGSKVEVLEGFDESFDALFETVATVVPCALEKDAAFLRWRYGPDSPRHRQLFLA